MNDITDKTHVIIMQNDYKIYITKETFDKLVRLMGNTSQKIITLSENDAVININSVLMIVRADNVVQEERIKKGDWKCKHGEWHKKGEDCGHGILKSFNKTKHK